MKANRVVAAALSAMMFTGSLAYAPSARADEVSPTGKGIVGLGLLGGEAVVITMSLVGVRNPWAYLGGGVAGAAAGAVGGYFVEQGSSDGRVPIYLLAGGLALIIPGVVLTLNGTAYQGNENATEDKAPTNVPAGPAADPGQTGGSAVAPATAPSSPPPSTPPPSAPPPSTTPPSGGTTTPPPATPPAGGGGNFTPAPAQAPQSMLEVRPGGMLGTASATQLRLGVPAPVVKNAFSTQERVKYGVTNQVSEVHLPVVSVTF
jgi:hypothetical protein